MESSGGGFLVVQKIMNIQRPRGCHLITRDVLNSFPEIKKFKTGSLNIFLKHTDASLTINENCCSDVRSDIEAWLNKMAPEGNQWTHSKDGPDSMPSHVKSSLIGVSHDIPIKNGSLALGTWQEFTSMNIEVKLEIEQLYLLLMAKENK